MRKTLRLLSYILSVALVIGIVSCSKDGPQDPQEQPGSRTQGASGPQGPAGQPGTANVIYSDWTDTLTYGLLGAPDTILGVLLAPQITADILNNGEIKYTQILIQRLILWWCLCLYTVDFFLAPMDS
jgi:hypothetical protein